MLRLEQLLVQSDETVDNDCLFTCSFKDPLVLCQVDQFLFIISDVSLQASYPFLQKIICFAVGPRTLFLIYVGKCVPYRIYDLSGEIWITMLVRDLDQSRIFYRSP